jgi:hypothetical protein
MESTINPTVVRISPAAIDLPPTVPITIVSWVPERSLEG